MEGPTRAEVAGMYDRIAESFDRTRRRPWPEVQEFAQGVPPGSRVLDLGCGNGRHARVLCDLGHVVIGLDAAPRLLVYARQNEPRAKYILGDLVRLPFRDRRLDAAIFTATIHHLALKSERLEAMRELRRVLRPGGRTLVSAWALERALLDKDLRDATVDRRTGDSWIPWRAEEGNVRRFYHLFRDGELRDLVLASGLRLERYFRSGDNDFVVAEHDG